jgi:hypothetical protein
MQREIEKLTKGVQEVSLKRKSSSEKKSSPKKKKYLPPTKVRRNNPKIPGNRPLQPRRLLPPDINRLSLMFGNRSNFGNGSNFGKKKTIKGLSSDMYTIKTSTIPNAGNGAFANIFIPKRTTLGYYKGKRLNSQQYDRLRDQSYVWELSSRSGPIYVDGKNPKISNWLRFLNDSRDRRVNVEPYQYRGNIYYRTTKNIKPGEEMFISYGDSYWD